MSTEVARGVLVRPCPDNEFIEDRPQALDVAFSKVDYLDGIGIELGSKVTSCIAVGYHIEVLPKQVLDEVVSVERLSSPSGA